MKGVSLVVFGKVQNVGFRFHTVQKAESLQIYGFVKNRADGSVYIEAEGKDDALEEFIEWCRIGPKWANVSRLTISNCPIQNFKDFVSI